MGIQEKLEVRWYEISRGESMYTSTFRPACRMYWGKKDPWCNVVPVESVHVSFDDLTSQRRIPARVASQIESAVRMHSCGV